MNIRMAGALALWLAGVAAAATCGGHGTPESLVVSTKWLADHVKDANLVVLAVGSKADYDAGHIAGSQFLEYGSVGVKGETGLIDRKSTRLNSSHRCISYAVFCLKKNHLATGRAPGLARLGGQEGTPVAPSCG